MQRIHRTSDLVQVFKFTDLTFSEVENVYFILLRPDGTVLKQVAITAEPDFPSDDVRVIDDSTVEVDVHRAELADEPFGKYTFQIRVAEPNVRFEDSVLVNSDSAPTFRLVDDYERTGEYDKPILYYGVTTGGDGGGATQTSELLVTDESKESFSGSAGSQAEINEENVKMDTFSQDLASLNRETDLFLADASAVITQAPPSVTAPTTETLWTFVVTKDSTNELLLTIDGTNYEATFKKEGVKYNWDLLMQVNNISGVANTVTTRVKRKSDDVTIETRVIDIPAEVGMHYFALNTISELNDATDTTVYMTIQAAESNLEIVTASSRIYADTPSVHSDVMHWAQVWDTSGTKTYYRNDVVRDDNFLSICIAPVETTDRPAPQHSGNIEYQMNYDGSGWETVTLADTPEVDTGHDMEVVNGGWFYGGRVWLFNDSTLEQTIAAGVVHADGTFEAIFRYTVPSEQITQDGWYEFRISQPMGVFPNTTFGLDIMIKSKGGYDDVAEGIWQYDGMHPEYVNPWAGKWSVRDDYAYLQIHKDQADNLGEVDLSVVQVGDIIELQQNPVMWRFRVTGLDSFYNNAYRFYVDAEIIDGEMTVNQNTQINITRESGTGSVKYVRVVDGTLPYDNIKGIKDWVYDDNMYGTDFFFEDAIQSPDWEVIAYSPFNASVSGGGDGVTKPSSTLDVVPYNSTVEAIHGTAASQYEINKENVTSIEIISGEVEQNAKVTSYTADAAIHIETDATVALPANELTIDFSNEEAPTFPDILDSDDSANHITLKKDGYRYIADYYLIVQTSDDTKTHQLDIRMRKVSDDSEFSLATAILEAGKETHHIYMPLFVADNTEDNNALYITLEASDDTLTLLEFHGHGYAKAMTNDTAGVTVVDATEESVGGAAANQYDVNVENVDNINTLKAEIQNQKDIIAKLVNASMDLGHSFPDYFPDTEANWDFVIAVPTSNADLLDANENANTVTFKKADVRYTWETNMVVKTHGTPDKTVTIRLHRVDDGTLIHEKQVAVEGGNDRVSNIVVPVSSFDNTEDNLEIYVTIQATDDEVEILDATSKIYSQNTSVTVGTSYFMIWAEQSQGVHANSDEWSFGNGADTSLGAGPMVPVDCELYAIGTNSADSQFQVAVFKNGSINCGESNMPANAGDSEFTLLSTPVQFAQGDIVDFYTTTVSAVGSTSGPGARVIAYFRHA